MVFDSKIVVDFLASRIADCEANMKKHWASWNSTRITFVMRSCWLRKCRVLVMTFPLVCFVEDAVSRVCFLLVQKEVRIGKRRNERRRIQK